MTRLIRGLLLAGAVVVCASAQPVVTGALNTASYIRPGFPNAGLAQGGMIAIFGRNLGPAAIVQAGSFPLPTAIGGTSGRITVNGQSRDLVMVYSLAGQVGAIVPSTTPVGSGQLTITYNGQTSANFPVSVVASQLGIFTINQGGSGPAVVQNVNSETDRPVNTILNAAKPGQAMILWGTGLGAISGADNGAPPVGNLNQPIEVLVGGRSANVIYKGRSGCCAGVDQIVFEVPSGVSGCYVPLAVKNGNSVSNHTSIAVAANGGTCSDPFGYTAAELSTANNTGRLNVGSVSLSRVSLKMSAMGINLDTVTEVAAGGFYSYDTSQLVASRGSGGTAVTAGACTLFTFAGDEKSPIDPVMPRALDAGAAINISGPNGSKRMNKGVNGLYSEILSTSTGIGGGGIPGLPGGIPGLPGGGGSAASYLTAGAYTTDNGAGGVDVGGFRSNLTIPGNFSWTNEAATTAVIRANGVTVNWSGAGANDYVYVSGSSFNDTAKVGAAFFCLERGNAGRLTVPSSITLGMPASSVIEGTETGQLSVGVTGEPSRFTARGLDVGTFSYSSTSGKSIGYR